MSRVVAPGDVLRDRGVALEGARVDALGRVRATTCGRAVERDDGVGV